MRTASSLRLPAPQPEVERARQESVALLAENDMEDRLQRASHAAPLAEETRQERTEPRQQKAITTGLPETLKAGIESLSSISMNDVQVHYNSSKPAQMQALAYTQGTDIHVGPGQQQHLAHEAWHVVQQMQGRVQPTLQAKGMPINDDQGLEWEADVNGAKAMAVARDPLLRNGHPASKGPEAHEGIRENRATGHSHKL